LSIALKLVILLSAIVCTKFTVSGQLVTFSLNTKLTILGPYSTPFEVALMYSGKYYSLGYARQSERVALFVLGYEPESMSDFGNFLLLFSVSHKPTRS
jgi:hypothetical protein